jgi:hypothetical protein
MSPLSVSDFLSNTNEQIEQAAKAIGRSPIIRKVFVAIYKGKRPIKTVAEIVASSDLDRKQVLTAGKRLADWTIVEQTKVRGDTAYRKLKPFYLNRAKILRLAGNRKELAKLPTKRRAAAAPAKITLSTKRADAERITIDEVDSFSKVRSVPDDGLLSKAISEKRFKAGLQKILKEPGKFEDWGGEKNDIYSTRLRIKGKRVAAAFALKGPAQSGKLVPGKMGTNGDQIQRLFETAAEVFFVQYGGVVSESVANQMQPLAVAKAVATGAKIRFGVIDGSDSQRLYRAYRRAFE